MKLVVLDRNLLFQIMFAFEPFLDYRLLIAADVGLSWTPITLGLIFILAVWGR